MGIEMVGYAVLSGSIFPADHTALMFIWCNCCCIFYSSVPAWCKYFDVGIGFLRFDARESVNLPFFFINRNGCYY